MSTPASKQTTITWNAAITLLISAMGGIMIPLVIMTHNDMKDIHADIVRIEGKIDNVSTITTENKVNLANHITQGQEEYTRHDAAITELQQWKNSYKPSYIAENRQTRKR